MRRRVHLVYPHGEQISAPNSIGRELGARLAADYEVVHHDWDECGLIRPEPGDVLLGHAHPSRRTCFRRSARLGGWDRVLMMSPFNLDLAQVAFLDPVIRDADLYLAITGGYWFDRIEGTVFSHWLPRMVRLDMAVDLTDYPPVKHGFNPPGRRRVLYIGHSDWQKNTRYLSDLAARMPDTEFAWIGGGAESIAGLKPLGMMDFSSDAAKALVAEYDFVITVGRFDANPTTVLEAMAWGLVPVCTPQSGYEGQPGIVNVPLDSPDEAVAVLRVLQEALPVELEAFQRANRLLLERHYNWDRFAAEVRTAIESDERPALGPEPLDRRMQLATAARRSPYAYLRKTCRRSVVGGIRRRVSRLLGRG